MNLGTVRNILTLFRDQIAVTTAGQTQDAGYLEDFVAELSATEDANGATLDVVIEDSFDDGVTWQPWITFAQLAANGSEVVVPTRPPAGPIRANCTVTGVGTWTPRVRLSAQHR